MTQGAREEGRKGGERGSARGKQLPPNPTTGGAEIREKAGAFGVRDTARRRGEGGRGESGEWERST